MEVDGQASITAGLHSILPAHLADMYTDRHASPPYGFMLLYTSVAAAYGMQHMPRTDGATDRVLSFCAGVDLFGRLEAVYRTRFLDDILNKVG